MTLNYLAFAIPAFFIFVYLEYVLARRYKLKDAFKYQSSVANFSIGIAERMLNLFIAASFYSLYQWIYNHYAIFHIPNQWYVWLFLLLATDLVWYWYHRLGHEINFLWAAHIVHHQSEEFNLSAAARITTIQAIFRNVFWCVLPFIGFHPTMIMVILLLHGAYSFFTHTQLFNRLTWLEYVFITPSLHGVHHAANEKYLDKNYGDVFVFWDKIFGTFQKQEDKPIYGLTHPLKNHSFLWQHFHYYLEILEACKQNKGLKAKFKIIFGSPAAMDQRIRPALEQKFFSSSKHHKKALPFKQYLNFQLLLAVLVLTSTTLCFNLLPLYLKWGALAFILITLINIGALMEQRKWIYYLECFRLIILSAIFLYGVHHLEFLFLPVVILILAERWFSLSEVYKNHVFAAQKG